MRQGDFHFYCMSTGLFIVVALRFRVSVVACMWFRELPFNQNTVKPQTSSQEAEVVMLVEPVFVVDYNASQNVIHPILR